jgi:hypothetical protein
MPKKHGFGGGSIPSNQESKPFDRSHPPETRWEACSRCHVVFPPEELTRASLIVKGRKRGYFCDVCAEILSPVRLAYTVESDPS